MQRNEGSAVLWWEAWPNVMCVKGEGFTVSNPLPHTTTHLRWADRVWFVEISVITWVKQHGPCDRHFFQCLWDGRFPLTLSSTTCMDPVYQTSCIITSKSKLEGAEAVTTLHLPVPQAASNQPRKSPAAEGCRIAGVAAQHPVLGLLPRLRANVWLSSLIFPGRGVRCWSANPVAILIGSDSPLFIPASLPPFNKTLIKWHEDFCLIL